MDQPAMIQTARPMPTVISVGPMMLEQHLSVRLVLTIKSLMAQTAAKLQAAPETVNPDPVTLTPLEPTLFVQPVIIPLSLMEQTAAPLLVVPLNASPMLVLPTLLEPHLSVPIASPTTIKSQTEEMAAPIPLVSEIVPPAGQTQPEPPPNAKPALVVKFPMDPMAVPHLPAAETAKPDPAKPIQTVPHLNVHLVLAILSLMATTVLNNVTQSVKKTVLILAKAWFVKPVTVVWFLTEIHA